MYDAVTVPDLPSGASYYAGYTNGNYANVAEIQARFPNAHVLGISVFAGGAGTCLDVEPGDATNSQAASVRYAMYYTSVSNADALVSALASGGILRSSYKLWTAHYTGVAHICSPSTCYTSQTADGTQYASNNYYDTSLLEDDFFGGAPAPSSNGDDMTPGIAYWNGAIYYAVRGSDGVLYYQGPDTKNKWQAVPNTNVQSGVAMVIDPQGKVCISYVNTSGVPCVVVRQPGGGVWAWGSLGGNVG